MDTLWLDLKYGFRILRNKPGFTFVALLAIALGIGANTAVFSILYATLWKSLPFKDAERLAIVWETSREKNQNVANPANYVDWKEKNQVFEDIAAFAQVGAANLTGAGEPEEVSVTYATPNIFRVLGVRPVVGRDFNDHDGIGDDITVILTNGLWRRKYGGDPHIAGREILISGRKATVAGILPPGLNFFVKEGSMRSKPAEIWSAYPITPVRRVRQGRYLTTVARLKPNVSLQAAQANMKLVGQQLSQQYPDMNAGWGINVVPLRNQLYGDLRKPLWILAGAVGFVLLIACTNVANLMLTRAVSRSREIAVRSSLGADRTRLVRQLLTENVLLSLIGGTAGIALAVWGTESLTLLGRRAGIDFGAIHLNLPVLIFSLFLSVLTGLFFGIIPSVVASHWNVPEQLKEGSRAATGLHLGKLRNFLVVIQLAVALVLLSGAALLIQSFWKLSSVNPGFGARQVLTFRLALPSIKYPEPWQRIRFFRNLVSQIQQLPDVKSAGMDSYLPFAGKAAGTDFHIQGVPDPPKGQDRITNVSVVDNGFFQAMQIPLRQGRFFQEAEMQEQKNVVLINETLARQFFPNENPIGRKIIIDMRDQNVPSEIIGIVGDVKQQQLNTPAEPAVYWAYPELAYNFMSIVVETKENPASVLPAVSETIHRIDPNQPLADVHTIEDLLDDSTGRARFNMALLSVLAGIALVLAGAGIYGVMSHAVAQRTQEMGIRMTLGANRSDILKMVLKDGWRILFLGAVAGCAIAAMLTRFIESLLFETSSSNPMTFLIVTFVLMLIGLIACWIPSRRASVVDPIQALRYE